MKTDTLFYQLFQNFPSIFFELIGKPTSDVSNYQFTAPEVKQRAFRFDGLFLPVAESPELPIYFVEVQFQKKPKFYSRLFAEIFLYFYKFPNLSREELEAMLGLSELRQTRVYQEAREEGRQEGIEQGLEQGIEQGQLQAKLKMVLRLLQRGLTIEEVAELLELDIETVRRAIQEQS